MPSDSAAGRRGALSADRVPRRDADVVIYDGQCRICAGLVQRLARWDRGQRLAFFSLHDPRVGEMYPDLSADELMQRMHVVTRNGRRLSGISAVRYLSRRLPLLWWIVPWLHIPGSLPAWEWCYRQFARWRHRWGRIESCEDDRCGVDRS